jgi:acyl-CoA reductase-like NAD-dependent aldehyde dehydrogenase
MLRSLPLRTKAVVSAFRENYGCFIGGKEVFPSVGVFEVENPATGAILCKVASADAKVVTDACEIAHKSFESGVWSRSDVRHRAKVLQNMADALRSDINRLAELEVSQTGRAVREMKAQLGRLPEWFEYFGALIRTHEGTVPPFFGPYLNYVKRVPLGVCGLLTPWNHPLLIAIKKIAPALATGNSIVLKPSELAPVSVLELAKLCSAAGLPDGVLNIVPGMGPAAGQALCSNPRVRKIDLTGGTNTGRAVGAAAGANLAGLITELGGKAPMIIFDDADVEQAVNGAAFATFVASGQTCIMGARVLVHDSIYDKFMANLTAKAKMIKLGDPTDVNTQMGPVISKQSRSRISDMVDKARTEGATVYTGAQIPPSLPSPFDNGYYYEPTILGVRTGMEIWKEEVFGPVVVGIPFKDEAEAVALANDSPYGLAAAVWTTDVMRAHRMADKLDVGIVWINDHHRNDPSSPWGGMKHSGIGRENGLSALHEYTQTKSVVVRTDPSKWDWFQNNPATRYS